MPFSISPDESGGYWVSNANTGRRMHKKPLSKRRALNYQRALEANVNKNFNSRPLSPSQKHGGDFTAKQKDSLQAIHNHAADLGAMCDGDEPDEEMAKHLKHGDYSMLEKQDKVQAMHDHVHELGAECPMPEKAVRAEKAVKFMVSSGMDEEAGEAYARQELGDIYMYASALQTLTGLYSEMDEPEDAKLVFGLMRGICDAIMGEIDEGEEAATGQAAEEKHYAKVAKREDINPERGKTEYGNVKFADEKNKKYPIDTEEHIRAAWNYINKEDNAGKYSAEDLATIKAHIVAAWKKKIDKEGPPSAEKSLDLSYIKALGIVIPSDKLAVKFTGRDEISFPTFLWGSPEHMDVEKDFFTRETDFMDNVYGKSPRPLTWDHGQDPMFKDASPVIGTIVDWADDEVARWATATLNKDKAYRNYLDKMIEQKALGASSDSAPQYVERVNAGNGHWIKRWPWIASALTPMPAEPRMKDFTPEFLKSWNLAVPEAVDEKSRRLQALILQERELKLKGLV